MREQEHPSARDITPATPPPTRFKHRVRVRYVECDPMGVAHHSSYIAWLEEARTEMLRCCGVSYADMEAAGVFLVVASLELRYRRPIRYDDIILIDVEASTKGRTRLRHCYTLFRAADGSNGGGDPERVATAETMLACVGSDGRPCLMPAWLAAADTDEVARG